jgi:hypothetical protein
MVRSERFCINSAKITHETIDGEVVIVNLASGSYYSLDSAGAEIWGRIAHRASFSEIVAYLTDRFDGKAEELAGAAKKLLEELETEGLIIKEPNAGETDSLEGRSVSPGRPESAAKATFTPPSLNKYTDMQDLLLLDPIHDVDEAGWPVVKPDAAKEDGKA